MVVPKLVKNGLVRHPGLGKGCASTSGMATVIHANTFLQRLLGAAALDSAIYEEVETDTAATGQAMAVVLLSSLAMGIGARGMGGDMSTIAVFGVIALITWGAWALLMYEIGTGLLPGPQTRSSPDELLRVLGFAATPGFAAVLGAVPGITVPVLVGTWLWTIAAMVVAVRQALDYGTTSRALAVVLLGATLAVVIAVGLGLILGPTAS